MKKRKSKHSRFFKDPTAPLGLSNLTDEGAAFYWAADEYIAKLYKTELRKQYNLDEVQRVVMFLCDWHAWIYTLKNSTAYKEAKLRQWLLEKRLREDAEAAESPEDQFSLSERLIKSILSPSNTKSRTKKRSRRMSRGMRSRKRPPRWRR